SDVLDDLGVSVDTDDGELGTAIAISSDGKYIAGWVNGPPMFAEGWMLYLDDDTNPGDGDCGLVTDAPDEIEDGLANLGLLQVLNDFPVPANQSFSLESVSFNAMIEPDNEINTIHFRFYNDSGDGPGNEISDLEVEPTSVETLGQSNG